MQLDSRPCNCTLLCVVWSDAQKARVPVVQTLQIILNFLRLKGRLRKLFFLCFLDAWTSADLFGKRLKRPLKNGFQTTLPFCKNKALYNRSSLYLARTLKCKKTSLLAANGREVTQMQNCSISDKLWDFPSTVVTPLCYN